MSGDGVPQDASQAASWLRKATEQGDAIAQFLLGGLYATGQGVPQDQTLATEWYRKAAGHGFPYLDAQFKLGVAYYDGKGVPQDYAQAMEWFRKAADRGHTGAQFNLGLGYSYGEGVPQNYAEAYFWLDLAASSKPEDLDQKNVAKARDDAASHLGSIVLAQVKERCRQWFADHGSRA